MFRLKEAVQEIISLAPADILLELVHLGIGAVKFAGFPEVRVDDAGGELVGRKVIQALALWADDLSCIFGERIINIKIN